MIKLKSKQVVKLSLALIVTSILANCASVGPVNKNIVNDARILQQAEQELQQQIELTNKLHEQQAQEQNKEQNKNADVQVNNSPNLKLIELAQQPQITVSIYSFYPNDIQLTNCKGLTKAKCSKLTKQYQNQLEQYRQKVQKQAFVFWLYGQAYNDTKNYQETQQQNYKEEVKLAREEWAYQNYLARVYKITPPSKIYYRMPFAPILKQKTRVAILDEVDLNHRIIRQIVPLAEKLVLSAYDFELLKGVNEKVTKEKGYLNLANLSYQELASIQRIAIQVNVLLEELRRQGFNLM